MPAGRTEIIFNETRTTGLSSVQNFTVPREGVAASEGSRITVWILAIAQPVAADFRLDFDGDEFPIQNKAGATVPADTWSPDTTEDLEPGDLVVRITPGGTPPDKLRVVAVLLRRT